MSANRLPVLTNSQMRCFRRCAREHFFSYVQGYRPNVEADALRFGSLVHVGLEAWWNARRAGESALDAAVAAIATHDADPFDAARAEVMLRGYDARWGAEAFTVLAVEAEFRAPLVNPETGAASRTFELGGKLDVVVEHEGRVKLMEHKTTSEDAGPGSDYWKRLAIDPQVSTYFAGGKASGHDIAECIYDVLGKPALRPFKATPVEDRKFTKAGALYANQREADETVDEFRARLTAHVAENPDRYYQRGTVVRLEQEEADAAHDTWTTARLIREAELAGRWARNPDQCVRWGRTCDFFGVCTGTASLEDPALFRKVERVHEELTEAA